MLTVLSYNIALAEGARLAAIADVVEAQGADVIALLEVPRREAVAELARTLGLRCVFGVANCGAHVAWLSRLPILRAINHRHRGLAKTLLLIEVAWAGGTLWLGAIHLASRHEPPEPVEEVPILLDRLGMLAGIPHLLVGDFNALYPGDSIGTPPPGVLPRGDALPGAPRRAIGQLLDAGYTDCFRAWQPHAPGYTYPTATPWLRLDYAFASSALAPQLTACEVVTGEAAARASDHFPLQVCFATPEIADRIG